jgi:ribosomal protein S18 acetylase RimI-like enzyme
MSTQVSDDSFRLAIERGDTRGVATALQSDPGLANQTIHWYLNRPNESDPLHFVSDCVGNGWLTNGTEGEIAKLLVSQGAAVDGTCGRESPLIAAASLGAGRVAQVLVDAGADLEAVSVFGARALHWAAWTGASATVELLLARGAAMEKKCSEFGATPLFWAVHGYGPKGPENKSGQVAAARALIAAGALVATANKFGETAIEMSTRCARPDMHALLLQSHAGTPREPRHFNLIQVEGAQSIAIARELFREYSAAIGIDLEYQGFSAELASLPAPYAPPTGALLIAQDAARMAGCVAMRRLDENTCEMKRLYVRAEYRGSGLGQTLVEAVIHAARQAGYRELRLDTLASMASAQSLYRRLGFVEIQPYSEKYLPDTRFYSLTLGR